MSPPPEIDDVAFLAFDLLEREGVPFVVMGGLAVNVWGVPRTTFDVDIEIDLPRERVPAVLHAAERAGFFFDDVYARGFTEQVGGQHPLVVIKRWIGGQAVHVDLFLAETAFLRRVFERAIEVDLGARRARVATAADLILFKLLAWRPKDRADLANLLAVQGLPEEPYLRAQAALLGVTTRLEETLRERGGA